MQQFTMWENQQQSAPQGTSGLPGYLNLSGEFIDITFTVISEQEINFRLANKTGSPITIRWEEERITHSVLSFLDLNGLVRVNCGPFILDTQHTYPYR